jgi:cysteine desulfurase
MSLPPPVIYLDNNATTQTDPAVVEAMLPYLTVRYGNPSSPYGLGKQSAQALQNARERVAALLKCEPGEIIFTSSGTESTNAAILSAIAVDPDRKHVVTTRVEHSATLKTCEMLAKRGYEITWLGVNSKGQVNLEEVEKALRSDTALLSVMWANNETGTLFPIQELVEIARRKGVYFHTDAVQAIGKIPIALDTLGIQFLSLSGHKLHCPKGVGALYVNKKTRFIPFMTGGSQENNKRGGTENVASIVALGKACELARERAGVENEKVLRMRNTFETALLSSLSHIKINGDEEHRLPNTSNLTFTGVDSEALLMLLDEKQIYCSAGSACTSGSHAPSHVLKAMGITDTQARSSLRFSFSHLNTEEEVHEAVKQITFLVNKIRSRTA